MKQQFFARNGSKKKDKKILTLKLKIFAHFRLKFVILSYDSYFHETFLGRTKYVQDA